MPRGPREEDKAIAKRLRIARVTAELSQTEAANHLGLTFQQLQKYESGHNRISAGTLLVLAAAYKMPIEWFFDAKKTKGADQLAEFFSVPGAAELAALFSKLSQSDRRLLVDLARRVPPED